MEPAASKNLVMFIMLIGLVTGCLKVDPGNDTDVGAPSSDSSTSASQENVIHDFSVRQKVKIPKSVIKDEKLSVVVLENSSGSFRMILDKEELKHKNSYDIPVSKLDEKIIPKYIYK